MKNQRDLAKARVEFKIHLYTFIVVMSLLLIIDLLTSPGSIWFVWPLLGWGIGLIVHALTVYLWSGEPNIKERMIEKEMKNQALHQH